MYLMKHIHTPMMWISEHEHKHRSDPERSKTRPFRL
jgi:hypothetical protein